ncbi:hypothetical protein C1H46_004745 [Malus baccata]|uniref:Uncharacterized protein n=1 Tax=Malus baccata TaxID=106549 RepID=A0A540NF42_MALBA|nr:hypothetical protein C1H46_004745 [Malus baccata]
MSKNACNGWSPPRARQCRNTGPQSRSGSIVRHCGSGKKYLGLAEMLFSRYKARNSGRPDPAS